VIAVISTAKYKKCLKESLKNYNVIIESYSKKGHQYIESVLSIDFQYLIISADICSDEELIRIISNINKSNIQVILIVTSKNKNTKINSLTKKSFCKFCYFTEDYKENIKALKDSLIEKKDRKKKPKKKQKKKLQNFKKKPNRKIIAFLNLTEKAGSTLLSTSYADYLAKKSLTPALVEMPQTPDCFYQFGLELFETDKKKFISIPHKIKESSNINKLSQFKLRNIMWLISDPRLPKIDSWAVNEMLQLLEHSCKADVVIMDVGDYMYHESIVNLLPMMDEIFAVIEPRPVNIIKSIGKINKFMKYQQYNSRVKVIFNKWDKSLNKIGLKDLVKLSPDIYVPNLNKEYLYKSEYNCLSALSEKVNKNKLVNAFQDISEFIWPQLNYKTVFNSSFVAEGS